MLLKRLLNSLKWRGLRQKRRIRTIENVKLRLSGNDLKLKKPPDNNRRLMNWRRKKDLKRKLLNLLQGKPRKNIFVNKRRNNVHLLYLSKVKMKSKSQKNSLLQTIAMIPSSQTKTLCPIMMMTSCSGHRHKSNLTT